MSRRLAPFLPVFSLIILSPLLNLTAHAQDDRSSDHREGLRENPVGNYGLTGAKIVVEAGRTFEDGVLIVRDGKISRVGDASEIPIPADVQKVDLTGKTIYPGLIDSFTESEVETDQIESGASYWNVHVRPELSMATQFQVDEDLNKIMRKQGFTGRLVVPAGGILKGSSAFVLNSDTGVSQALIKTDVAQHARLTISRRRSNDGPSYPNSPMGAVALARQAFYDAQWYGKALRAAQADPSVPLPDMNAALQALQATLVGDLPLILDSANELYFLRADRFAREFGVPAILHGSGLEFRRLDAVAATGRSIILPVNFPTAPNVSSFETTLNVSLETLLEWELCPENPARVAAAGIEFTFCSHGLDDEDEFLEKICVAVKRGLSPEDALRAITTTPAKLLGLDGLVGSLHAGKLANFTVTDGELFDAETEILETWVGGIREEYEPAAPFSVEGNWAAKTKSPGGKLLKFNLELEGKSSISGKILLNRKPTKKNLQPLQDDDKKDGKKKKRNKKKQNDEAEEDAIKLTKSGIQNARFSATFDSSDMGAEGTAQITLIFAGSNKEASGFLTWPSGKRVPIVVTKRDEEAETKQKHEATTRETEEEPSEEEAIEINYPLGAFGVCGPAESEGVLIKNVTVWTCGPDGILENASVLFADGVIQAVGTDLSAPKGFVVIDGKGHHLTPGIIDCHSHIASDGGINESGQAITAEVRIGDFINCDDMNIYRQLAGGVTTSNILHGSANPIGGQNQVIKLRWGLLDEEMKFAEAPAGIKFALGENVKRSRDPDGTRYPRTRMGVEQIFVDEFRAAQGYEQDWKNWERNRQGLPPRRDLELDAIVQILNGDRWIHCHSYRQDEILALIRLLDGLNIQIGTFQHILEGYKVADEMQRHGAMGSAFSDWWAYKFEVYDAIPFAGALMHEAGVVVSFNSDDRELARHLNHEAAKAVKYGGVDPEEALKFVTLNPAKQLRIDQYVGSIQVGKHADLVLWSGNPLSTLSRCEKTWIDGRSYFDRETDKTERKRFETLKQKLVQKVLSSGEAANAHSSGRPPKPAELWPNYDEFCRCKGSQSQN